MMRLRSRNRAIKSKTKVYIVTPVMLNFTIDCFTSQFCTSACMRGIADWEVVPARTAEDARNQMMRLVIANKKRYTDFFFLDADSFPYDEYMIERLLMHNKPAIAGPTPTQRKPHMLFTIENGRLSKRQGPIRKLWNVVVERDGKLVALRRSKEDPKKDELPDKPFICKHVGCTGLLVAREVIEKMEQPYQQTLRNEIGETVLSEDYYFCQQIQSLGYDIWIDPALKSGHRQTIDVGNY